MAASVRCSGARCAYPSTISYDFQPPDYNTSGKKYPVVYLLHGLNDFERGWTQSGMANNIMDNLLADKKALPAIIVMPFGHTTTGATGAVTGVPALLNVPGWNMEKEMLDYVMPYVEKEFRVFKDRQHRAIPSSLPTWRASVAMARPVC